MTFLSISYGANKNQLILFLPISNDLYSCHSVLAKLTDPTIGAGFGSLLTAPGESAGWLREPPLGASQLASGAG